MEEGPAKEKKRQERAQRALSQDEPVLEEEDEEDEDDEDDKFDIDDSLSDTNGATNGGLHTPDSEPSPRTVASMAFKAGLDPHVYSKTGTDSPDRYHAKQPHPPRLSPRHMTHSESSPSPSPASSTLSKEDEFRSIGENGDRDNIHGPRAAHQSARSRIPRDRDVEAESIRTPRAFDVPHRRAPSKDPSTRRAFAVWGHDESDSAASDGESS